MNEIFVKLEEYPNYEVSNMGYIRNINTGKSLSRNYHSVLTKKLENGELVLENVSLPMIVATVFIPNPDNYPIAKVIKHDFEPKYAAENLRWCFYSEDLTGQQRDRLYIREMVVIEGKPHYLCDCSCGNTVTRSQKYFGYRTRTKSCGCTLNDPRKHGRCSSDKNVTDVTYSRWASMKTRATNPNFSRADCYVEKGISMDPRWGDFSEFLKDMGDCPSKKHSLDRIDGNKNYNKENCRWVTFDVQVFNKTSSNEKSGKITGVCLSKSGKWNVRWREQGKERSKTFLDFIEAVKFRQQKELEIYNTTRIDIQSIDCSAYTKEEETK